MSRLVRIPLENGSEITVEVEERDSPAGPTRVSRGSDLVEKANQTLEKSLEQLRPAAAAVVELFRSLCPEELAVEFGFRFSADAGVIIAKAGTEANFRVTLHWKRAAGYGG